MLYKYCTARAEDQKSYKREKRVQKGERASTPYPTQWGVKYMHSWQGTTYLKFDDGMPCCWPAKPWYSPPAGWRCCGTYGPCDGARCCWYGW